MSTASLSTLVARETYVTVRE